MRIGHDEILEFMKQQFRVTSWDTVKRWRKKGMPIHRQWCANPKYGKPFIIEQEIILWQLKNNP